MKYKNFVKKSEQRKKTASTLLIGEALEDFLKRNFLEEKYQCAIIAKNWKNIVEEHVARCTESIFTKHNKLYIKLSSAPLKQELFFKKKEMLRIIYKLIGKEIFNDIVFF